MMRKEEMFQLLRGPLAALQAAGNLFGVEARGVKSGTLPAQLQLNSSPREKRLAVRVTSFQATIWAPCAK
jgi:hypothetical protein